MGRHSGGVRNRQGITVLALVLLILGVIVVAVLLTRMLRV
jgi:hypothetical protein